MAKTSAINITRSINISFARVCVEVDLTKPLVPGCPVGLSEENEFFQEFAYEGISVYCYRCGVVGHRVEDCKCTETIDQIRQWRS